MGRLVTALVMLFLGHSVEAKSKRQWTCFWPDNPSATMHACLPDTPEDTETSHCDGGHDATLHYMECRRQPKAAVLFTFNVMQDSAYRWAYQSMTECSAMRRSALADPDYIDTSACNVLSPEESEAQVRTYVAKRHMKRK